MLFDRLIQRKLSSLLRPYLIEEPVWDYLKLGFRRSRLVVRNLRFDAAVINVLISGDDDDGELRLLLKSVSIDELVIVVSHWSAPAFAVDVRGFNVTLHIEKRAVSKRVDESIDVYLGERKKQLLAQIDPHGYALHESIENMMMTSSSKLGLKDSLKNLVLAHCCLRFHDSRIQVEYPILGDTCSWSCYSRELSMESSNEKIRCFLGGLFGLIFVPYGETSFSLKASELDIGAGKKDDGGCILSCVNPCVGIRLKDCHLENLVIFVPEMNFLFSPSQLQMIQAFNNLLYAECKSIRSGSLLWGIAKSKIHNYLLPPRFMLYKLVLAAVLWLRLVKEYQAFLSLVGYPESGLKQTPGRKLSSAQQLKRTFQEVELRLPAEAVASARRVARQRAALRAPSGEISVSTCSHLTSFRRMFLWMSVMWQAFLDVFKILMAYTCLYVMSSRVDQSRIASEVSDPSCCLYLSLGKVSVVVSSKNASRPTPKKKNSTKRAFSTDLDFLFLSTKGLYFIYEEGLREKYLSFCLGSVEVASATVSRGSKSITNSRNIKDFEEYFKKSQDGLKAIVHGEPALMCHHPEKEDIENEAVPNLELSGEMELTWDWLQSIFQGSKSHYDGSPWVICNIHTFLANPGIGSPDSGFTKCSLLVGKLNFVLGHSSVQLISTLLEQFLYASYRFNVSENTIRPQHSARIVKDSKNIGGSGTLKSSVERMKIYLFNMLPDYCLQMRAVVAGPKVQIFLRNEGVSDSTLNPSTEHDRDDGVNFVIDIQETAFTVWQPEKFVCVSNGEHHKPWDDIGSDFLKMQDNLNGFLESGSADYVSKGQILLSYHLRLGGMNAYWENLVENCSMQVLLCKPVTAEISSVRKFLYSFSKSVVASSLSFRGAMSGATCLVYMDELSVISQVVESLFAVALVSASGDSAFHASQNPPVTMVEANADPVNEILTGFSEEKTATLDTLFCMQASVELVPFDIIFHDTRNGVDKRRFPPIFDAYNVKMPGLPELTHNGVWLSVQRTCINISLGETMVEVDANFGGFHTILFTNKSPFGAFDKSGIEKTVMHSVDCLHEISLSGSSLNFIVDFLIESEAWTEADNGSSSVEGLLSRFSSAANSRTQYFKHIQDDDGLKFHVPASSQTHWLLVNFAVGIIFVGTCSIKNGVLGAHVADKLQSSVDVGEDFRSISVDIQGGPIIIDTSVLVMFARCLTSYLDFVMSLLCMGNLHNKSMEGSEPGVNVSMLGGEHVGEPAEKNLLEACNINLSHFSIILLSQDENGVLRGMRGKVAFSLKLWLENRMQKFLFDLSHLEILSEILDVGLDQMQENNQIPHFYSAGYSNASIWSNHENSSGEISHSGKASGLSNNASSSKRPSSSAIDSTYQNFQGGGNYILERLASSISAENPFIVAENSLHYMTQGWVGRGSISGLNLTLSLSEIKMLMTVVESLSEVSSEFAADHVEGYSWASVAQKSEMDFETALPDGAIVAIQDVHQHMYVAVEGEGSKYRVTGAVHYSVAGMQALFRVKWQKQRRWRFSTSCFSLVSLYAKTDSGDPLCLNYSASSSFVDISCSNDSACALWKVAYQKHETIENDIDLHPLTYLSKNTFSLVNKKNDSAAAFINGSLEFVKKPGNPFKFKVFQGHSLGDVLSANVPEPLGDPNISGPAAIFPCITLKIEKVTLVIVHELSDAQENLLLLQGSIDDTELTVQLSPQKTRVISTFTSILHYFDSHRNCWRELVQPIEISIYWRSTSRSQDAIKSSQGMYSRFYVRIQELDLSLTELSLDILLYLVGQLEFAGPFAVQSSAILTNCCKVDNQLELDVLCHLDNRPSAKVGRRQSAIFFMRHLVTQPLEEPCVKISLEVPGISSTSSVLIPLAETKVLAWRTRITSLQDPKTYPGSFIVFDISKTTEEGLSLTISPLLRIHNKTHFPVELRIQRVGSIELESASVLLREGDAVDDCVAAFDATSLVGGPKKALRSLGVGNFVFSFRPDIKGEENFNSCSVEWSDNLEGGKAVRLSGVIDKFSYQVRKALSADSWKYSFSTASCSVISGNAHVAKVHFLVQSMGRDVPIIQPTGHRKNKNSSIALQEQKEIFLLPTVRVSNLLESDIDVLLAETEISDGSLPNINRATVPFGLTVDLYANPAVIFFTVTLPMFGSSCKPVNCGQLLKKLSKKKDGVRFLDVDLDFCRGQYFACLRLARSERGILEAIVFTQYTLRNESEFPLFCATPNVKPSIRNEVETHSPSSPPNLGSFLPPKSIRSWFLKSRRLCVKLSEEQSAESSLDLDALSGLAEMTFLKSQSSESTQLVKLGISLGPLMNKIDVPARMVSIVPRYIIANESEEQILVRQCFLKDGFGEAVSISSKQRTSLLLRVGSRDKRDITVFDKLLRKHKVSDDSLIFVQFKPDDTRLRWSGPVCIASLGRFFLKFRRSDDAFLHQSNHFVREDESVWEFGAVHVVEEASSFVLNFHKPLDIGLPYRIENHMSDTSITYYQKDTFEPETLASGGSVCYAWDDMTRPHKLMVKINGVETLREISLDKLRRWKPFFRIRQQSNLTSGLPLSSRVSAHRGVDAVLLNGIDVQNVGYEVYADGPTRVLRICHSPGSHISSRNFHSSKMIQLRISYFAIRLLEPCKQNLSKDVDRGDPSVYTPIMVGRLENISLDTIIIDQRKYNQIRVQSLNVDEKWAGAPFAAMLRRHLTSGNDVEDPVIFAVFVLYPSSSMVQEVKYSSIVLQPIDLNLDEETLMKVVPFWRTSLSTNTQSQQYYFDHFEIHPVKINASFLPEDSYSSYSSAQETLRSLLHSVIKIPAIKNVAVELNGILVTHALVTTRELILRCAQHYSWYAMRAVYIAKGSPLLPPTFASVFDDLASSSLDVFFDPSSSLFNVRGLTLGTFKLISKTIQNKGLSGTRRYFGDLSKTMKNAGSSILFAALTEVTDSVLKGAESSGLNGMVTGFHHGILKLAMEPSFLGTALLEGGPDRKIKLDRVPGVDELYVEGYLQGMLDTIYKQEYLRVRVIDDQVILKNLPPNSSLIDEILDRVKDFLVSKALLKGDYSARSQPLRHLRREREWRIGPTVLTLCEHLFVSFAIRMLRRHTNRTMEKLKLKGKLLGTSAEAKSSNSEGVSNGLPKRKLMWRWGIGRFALSAVVAYVDGRLCRCIPNPVARRIVSGFLLSFLDNNDPE